MKSIKRNATRHSLHPVSGTIGCESGFLILEQVALASLAAALLVISAEAIDLDPQLIGRWPGFNRGAAQGIAASGNFVYAAAGGFQVIDVSNPGAPRRVGGVNGSTMRKVKLSGQFAYVAEYDALQVIDVSDPTSPRRVGGLDLSAKLQEIWGLAVWDQYACIMGGSAQGTRLQMVDVSNPASPRQVGKFDVTAQALDVAVFGSHAFVADGRSGLQVLDLRDPTSPKRIGGYKRDGASVSAVGLSDNYVYVAESPNNLQVIDVGDPGNPRPMGRCNLNGYPYLLEVSGSRAFVATYTTVGDVQRTAIEIIDVSDPGLPRRIGGYDAQEWAAGLAVSGVNLYATDYGVLHLIDISNPAAPRRVAGLRTDGVVDRVAVLGHYAYVAESYSASDGGSGLRVIDVSDPRKPQDVGGIDTDTEVFRERSAIEQLALSDSFACLIERRSDWRSDRPGSRSIAHLIDIRNPTHPKRMAAMEVSSEWSAVSLSGQFAYLAEGWNDQPQSRFPRWRSRLAVLDLSDPTNPQRVVGTFETTGTISVGVLGHFVFLTGDDYTLIVLDVSNPANPRKVSQLNLEGGGGVTLSNGYAYVPGGGGLQVIDIRDPANPRIVTSFDAASGNYGFSIPLGNLFDSPAIKAVDLSDPRNLRRAGACILDGYPIGAAAAGNIVYVATRPTGLEIIDFGNAANPQRLSAFSSGLFARAVAASGRYACLLEEDGGNGLRRLTMIDLDDLARPRKAGFIDLPEGEIAHGLAASDKYACVIAGPTDGTTQHGRLVVFDIRNPADPQRVATLDTPGYLSSVALSGAYAYLVENGYPDEVYGNLHVIDISDPVSPRKVGTCERREWGGPLAVSATYAYLGTDTGLEVIDLSDPAHPARLGRCKVPGGQFSRFGFAVAISGHHAYLASWAGDWWPFPRRGRLEIIDVSDPADPQWVGGHDTIPASMVAVSGRYAFVGGFSGGVEVFDVRDPANPRRAGGNSAPDLFALAVHDGKVLAATYEQGLLILNPFSALRFRSTTLKDDGSIRLNLSGLNGQRARLERSANLADWQSLRTITLDEDGFGFLDETLDGPSGFYRAIEQDGP